MDNDATHSMPPISVVEPNGSCYCGCGQAASRGKYFTITHDRKAESRVIKERFGNIATFVVWAEANLPVVARSNGA